MLQNFFSIAISEISRHKGLTFINVTGPAVGLAASVNPAKALEGRINKQTAT